MNVIDLKCQFCDINDFQSRNKLFKHIKLCKLNPSNNSRLIEQHLFQNIIESLLIENQDIHIYVVGGRLRGRTLQSVERFSFKKYAWELTTSMIENRGSHGAVSVGNYIYAIGGGGLKSNLATCEKYNINTTNWELIEPMQSFRHALATVAYDNKSIYAIGGWYDGSKCSSDVEVYDINLNSWNFVKPMNTPRRLLGASCLNDKIYTFGGISNDGEWFTSVVEIYDIKRDIWSKGPDLPIAEANVAIAINDRIYIFIFGKGVYEFLPNESIYLEKNKLPIDSWYNFDIVTIGGIVFLQGGNANGVWLQTMYGYNTYTNEWQEMPNMLRQRRRCASAIITVN